MTPTILVWNDTGFISYHICLKLAHLKPHAEIMLYVPEKKYAVDISHPRIKVFDQLYAKLYNDVSQIYLLATHTAEMYSFADKCNARVVLVSSNENIPIPGIPKKLDVRIARLFGVYGPRMHIKNRSNNIIYKYIQKAITREPLTCHGEGNQKQTFCYVNDAADALIKIMDAPANQDLNYDPIDIASDEITTSLLAKTIIMLTDSMSTIIYFTHTNQSYEPPHILMPDTSNAKQLLNWTPETKLKDGLQKTIKYFRG